MRPYYNLSQQRLSKALQERGLPNEYLSLLDIVSIVTPEGITYNLYGKQRNLFTGHSSPHRIPTHVQKVGELIHYLQSYDLRVLIPQIGLENTSIFTYTYNNIDTWRSNPLLQKALRQAKLKKPEDPLGIFVIARKLLLKDPITEKEKIELYKDLMDRIPPEGHSWDSPRIRNIWLSLLLSTKN